MSLTDADVYLLAKKAAQLRKDIVTMLYQAGSGHPGGALSAIDILVVLHYKIMRFNKEMLGDEQRDRFILSKGHACPALYAVLADLGFFSRKCLFRLRRLTGFLQGHPDRNTTPGIEVSTGSLGQGLSMAQGKALALRLKKLYDPRVYCMVGDGEIQEGQIWEAAMGAAHHKLDNLILFIDNNGLQIDGPVEEIKSIYPIACKMMAFGWHVQTIDGHDYNQIYRAVQRALANRGNPSCIIARTIKGKGVSFMENNLRFHGVAPNEAEKEKALAELNAQIEKIEREAAGHGR